MINERVTAERLVEMTIKSSRSPHDTDLCSALRELQQRRTADDDTHRCFICNETFQAGELVLPSEDGLGHRACLGEDRDGYVADIGSMEPLGPDEPIPVGEPYDPADYAEPERASGDPVAAFLADVAAEITRARAKFPGDNLTTIAMFEEAGEVAKAVLDESPDRVRKECVQLACMAARIVLDGDSSTTKYRMERGGLGPIAGGAS